MLVNYLENTGGCRKFDWLLKLIDYRKITTLELSCNEINLIAILENKLPSVWSPIEDFRICQNQWLLAIFPGHYRRIKNRYRRINMDRPLSSIDDKWEALSWVMAVFQSTSVCGSCRVLNVTYTLHPVSQINHSPFATTLIT